MPEAFAIMRRYARDHNARLSEVAQRLVSRELGSEQLLDHSMIRPSPENNSKA